MESSKSSIDLSCKNILKKKFENKNEVKNMELLEL